MNGTGEDGVRKGLWNQLRSQDPVVKFVLALVCLLVTSPVTALVTATASEVAGGLGILLVVASVGGGAIWFVASKPAPNPRPVARAVLRYCETCGSRFSPSTTTCPRCDAPVATIAPGDAVATAARLLNAVSAEYEAGRVDPTSFARIRSEWERRLWELRVERPPEAETVVRDFIEPVPPPQRPRGVLQLDVRRTPAPAPVEEPAAIAVSEVASATGRPAAVEPLPAGPSRGPRELGRVAIGWAAERQADILLYVGAFLLSVAAIIFVASAGQAIGGNVRFAVLTIYAVGFLGLGVLLHRWERVKEAGPVFLALGATLVPLDFIALRTQVLSREQLPNDVLWLLASTTCAGLYFALAARGYGWLYALPGIPAALIAWASLGSVLGLPVEWFGPWFTAVAAATYVTATALLRRLRAAKWVLGFSIALGVAAIAWTQVTVAATGDHRAALPVAYLAAAVAVATGLHWAKFAAAFAALPPLVALAADTGWWALFGLAPEWHGAFVAATGAGYLVVAHYRPGRQAAAWGGLAASAFVLALLATHAGVAAEEAGRGALPATYAIVFAGAAGAFGRWRWVVAGVALPALATMVAATAAWATEGTAVEWYGAIAGIAVLAYLALALFDRDRTAGWRWAAAACAGLGPVIAHVALASEDGAERWALTAAYLPVLLAVTVAAIRWRFTWRTAPAGFPIIASATTLTASWAAWDLSVEWFACFAAAAGLGHLVLAHFDEPRVGRRWGALAAVFGAIALAGAHAGVAPGSASHAALPAAYALVLTGCSTAFARWRWIEAGALLPPLAAATALTAVWASAGLNLEWYACFAAAAALGYLLLARFDNRDRTRSWQSFATGTGSLALVVAYATLPAASDGDRLALPAAHVILLMGAGAATAQWRFSWRVAPGVLPLLAGLTAITGSWALWDLAPEWYGAFAAAAALGFVANAWLDAKRWTLPWLRIGGAVCVVGLAHAQAWQLEPAAAHGALPLAYGVGLLAATVTVARWRLVYPDGVSALPVLVAAFGASLFWATVDMPLEWLSAWIALGAAGYSAPAIVDLPRRSTWRVPAVVGGGVALIIAHGLAFEPDLVRWQLPVSYAVLLGGWTAQALRLRDGSLLLPPLLAALGGAALLWAAGAQPHWWSYPAIAVSALLMATSQWWERNEILRTSGWPYAIILGAAATVAVLPADYHHAEHGVAAQLLAAALMLTASFRSDAPLASFLAGGGGGAARTVERTLLVQACFAFLYGAAASLNGVLEISGTDRAWVFAALGSAGWMLVAARVRGREGFWAFAPVGLVGGTVAGIVGAGSDGTVTGVLAVATAGAALAFVGSRRWLLLGLANAFLFLGVWTGWRWLDLSIALLPIAFAAVALVEWGALLTLRKYTRTPRESDYVITCISWGPWMLSALVSGILLARQQAEIEPGASLLRTDEWALAAAVLGMAAAAVTAEGLRLARRWVWVAGSAVLLGALLMAIATRQPDNVQAYTAPAGVYLVGIALTFSRSPNLFRQQLLLHEAVVLVGCLHLVLPPAEQSFEPGGGVYGLELLGIGLALLTIGLLLHARWLVAAGVTTLTATSARMVTGGLFSTPYWLLLGAAGTALIGFGLLVLLERERWDRFRVRVVDWWRDAQQPPPSDLIGPRV